MMETRYQTPATVAALLTLAAMALQPMEASPAIARASSYESFQSPSANIYCGIGLADTTTFTACEIVDHAWAAPPRPMQCMGGVGGPVHHASTRSAGNEVGQRTLRDDVHGQQHRSLFPSLAR